MLTVNNQFEHELRKLISTEIDRIKDILADGAGVPDFTTYRDYVGQIAGLRRVAHSYCEEVETKMNEANR